MKWCHGSMWCPMADVQGGSCIIFAATSSYMLPICHLLGVKLPPLANPGVPPQPQIQGELPFRRQREVCRLQGAHAAITNNGHEETDVLWRGQQWKWHLIAIGAPSSVMYECIPVPGFGSRQRCDIAKQHGAGNRDENIGRKSQIVMVILPCILKLIQIFIHPSIIYILSSKAGV